MDEYMDVPEEPKRSLCGRLKKALWRFKEAVVFSIGERLPPRETHVTRYNGHSIYTCPRCGEFVYHEKQCIECGQRFLPGAKTIGGILDEQYTEQ